MKCPWSGCGYSAGMMSTIEQQGRVMFEHIREKHAPKAEGPRYYDWVKPKCSDCGATIHYVRIWLQGTKDRVTCFECAKKADAPKDDLPSAARCPWCLQSFDGMAYRIQARHLANHAPKDEPQRIGTLSSIPTRDGKDSMIWMHCSRCAVVVNGLDSDAVYDALRKHWDAEHAPKDEPARCACCGITGPSAQLESHPYCIDCRAIIHAPTGDRYELHPDIVSIRNFLSEVAERVAYLEQQSHAPIDARGTPISKDK